MVTCRGKRLARGMPCRARELVAHRALPERGTRRGKVLVVSWLAFPASSSCQGFVLRAVIPASSSCLGLALFGWPSRQAPPAGTLAQILCSWMAQKGTTESLGDRLASLAAGCYDCLCTSSGY